MASELKPCPFCGGNNLNTYYCDIEGWIAHIKCDDCDDMIGPMSEYKYESQEEAYKDAATRWNTRPAPAATDTGLVSNCDGKEQEAFETWAKSKRYDMHEHPMHYLFLDPKTNAAREGWNEAIRYCHSQAEELLAAAHDEKMFHVNDAVKAWNEVSRLETRVETLEADNAAQAARIKETEDCYLRLCEAIGVTATNAAPIDASEKLRSLEAKLAAAETFIKLCADGAFVNDPRLRGAARVALGGKSS